MIGLAPYVANLDFFAPVHLRHVFRIFASIRLVPSSPRFAAFGFRAYRAA